MLGGAPVHMKPDDSNGDRPTADRPLRVLLIAGSDRRQYNCPGVDSKARALVIRMSDRLPQEWEIDIEDIGNVYGRAQIRSCNACVSTSMALCVWPCNCYAKANSAEPDLMWDLDLYARLDLADAWAIVGPHNWYGPSSNLKLMFDRLVCMSGGNPREELIDHKDPEKAMAFERSPQWDELSVNHLEGRSAGIFCYGDGGGLEIDADGRPKKLLHPEWFEPAKEPWKNLRDAYAGIAWQCRYSGIEVPDGLWRSLQFGSERLYADNQSEHLEEQGVFAPFDDWVEAFVQHVAAKGKVEPGRWRAHGYEPPAHRWADAKLKWRDLSMRVGHAPEGSSPQIQEHRGLNRDVTLRRSRGEGEKLRS